jgi:hypothetical protein
MSANDVLAREILGYGAYVCLRRAAGADARALGAAPVEALAERLGLRNEFAPSGEAGAGKIAFLRRIDATPAQVEDAGLLAADAVVHVVSREAGPVDTLCAELPRLLGAGAAVRVLRGVARPRNYTGAAMNNFAYAHQVVQQPGAAMPHAFLVPMNKTAEWWRKDWMERHTYFLPRYDDTGRMVSEGHALASAAGIACLLRRTYRHEQEPAPEGAYDFLTYFECADADVPTFHAVCEALRDVRKNPEWKFVREGPTWHGRRVATWAEVLDGGAR